MPPMNMNVKYARVLPVMLRVLPPIYRAPPENQLSLLRASDHIYYEG